MRTAGLASSLARTTITPHSGGARFAGAPSVRIQYIVSGSADRSGLLGLGRYRRKEEATSARTHGLLTLACRRKSTSSFFKPTNPRNLGLFSTPKLPIPARYKRGFSTSSHVSNSVTLSPATPIVVPASQDVGSTTRLADATPTHDFRLPDMGLAGYTPTGLFQQLIEMVSVNGHVPFWASIIVSTVVVRLVLSPLAAPLMRETSRFLESLPEIWEAEKQRRLDIGGGKRRGRETTPEKILEGLNLDSRKLLLQPVLHVSMLSTLCFGLKGMTDVPVPQIIHGGFGWISNLSLADPYHILPILAPLFMMGAVKVNSVNNGIQYLDQAKFQPAMATVTTALIAITWNFPTAILICWITSNAFTVCRALWMQRSRTR